MFWPDIFPTLGEKILEWQEATDQDRTAHIAEYRQHTQAMLEWLSGLVAGTLGTGPIEPTPPLTR